MRRTTRFLLGVAVGGGALAAYLWAVGAGAVAARLTALAPAALATVAALVIAEALTDAVGVGASVAPLGDGLTPGESVQFALAGDFLDVVSPAGPASSEPILARFIGVTTGTTYGEALGVRSVAKYVKAAAQLLVSTALGAAVLVGGTAVGDPATVVGVTGLAVVAVAVGGAALVRGRTAVSRALAWLLTPVVVRLSPVVVGEPADRDVVAASLDRFWTRALRFRDRPRLVAAIAAAAVGEQVLQAAAVAAALSGVGVDVPFALLVVVVPLPQAASVVPIPGSLGTYDVLLGGGVSLVAGAPAEAAAAAVLLVRTAGLLLWLAAGGVAVALLRGWRPGAGDDEPADPDRADRESRSGGTGAAPPAEGGRADRPVARADPTREGNSNDGARSTAPHDHDGP